MKLIIEIDDKDYELAKADKVSCGYQCRHIMVAVKNGTPYNPSGDLISREALKAKMKEADAEAIDYEMLVGMYEKLVDEAQAVEPEMTELEQRVYHRCGFVQGVEYGKNLEKPQGEWIEFADYVARNVVSEDFSEDVDFYAEVLCRKLVKLGLVKLDGDIYKYCGADLRKGGKE